MREAVVENADFPRARSVALDDERRCCLLQVGTGLLQGPDNLHADTALSHIGFEDERDVEAMLGAKLFEGFEAFGGRRAFQ